MQTMAVPTVWPPYGSPIAATPLSSLVAEGTAVQNIAWQVCEAQVRSICLTLLRCDVVSMNGD
jgi:hypothetical protein